MCIRDSYTTTGPAIGVQSYDVNQDGSLDLIYGDSSDSINTVSYTHLRAHETVLDIVCRLLLEKKKNVLTKLTIQL